MTEDKNPPDFLILAAPYTAKSAGIRFLYELSDDIQKLGYTASVLPFGLSDGGKNFFLSYDSQRYYQADERTLENTLRDTNTILICGENFDSRWYGVLPCIRYYLNHNGALQITGQPCQNDFLITWSEDYCPSTSHVVRKSLVKGDFDGGSFLPSSDRHIDLAYVGKAALKAGNWQPPLNTLQITRNWPESTNDYVYLMQRSRFIFSYDLNTSVLEDAVMNGCCPVLMNESPDLKNPDWIKMHYEDGIYSGAFIREHDLNEFDEQRFRDCRQIFLQKTQELNSLYGAKLKVALLDARSQLLGVDD